MAVPSPVRAADAPLVVREIYVPFGDLNILLENQPQRVLLPREEYEALVQRAKKSPARTAPQGAVLVAADYVATAEEDRVRWTGTLVFDVLEPGVQALALDLSGVGIRSARLDGKAAPIGRGPDGRLVLFVEGKGRRELVLDMVSPLAATAAQQVLTFRLPQAPAARLRLTVPGDVEVKTGASVVSRVVDEKAGVTRFELLAPAGDATLVMTLNSRLQRRQRVVAARSVLVDEVTQTYERLHGTVSLAVLHQPVRQFRFVVPDGFEITQVTTPLLARWSIVNEPDRRVLDVQLREETVETVVVSLSAMRARPPLAQWSFPRLEPLDVVGHAAVVGLLLEDRLDAESLDAKRLIALDHAVLARAMPATAAQAEPGAVPLRAVATYYAPQTPFELSARFHLPPAEISVRTNVLLVLGDRGHVVRGGFLLTPRVEKLFAFEFSVPPGWHVTSVTGPENHPVPFERFGAPDQAGRVQVRPPQGVPPGRDYRILFQAVHTPTGWLEDWESVPVAFPVFAVRGATHDVGALAIDAQDDMAVRPDVLERLTPLGETEKEKYGLGGVPSSLAYRYEGQGYRAALVVHRTRPRLTARTFSFVRVESDAIVVHDEIVYTVDEARARHVAFSLPETSPAALAIAALDDTKIKESASRVEGGRRHWTVLLEEPRRGTIRLGVDFQQPLPAEKSGSLALPAVRAEGVAYQSGLVAVEGSPELDVEVQTSARKVDVGELADAAYQPGRRLLGAYGFVGEPVETTIKVARHPGFGLYPAIVQKAELNTNVAVEGTSQTEAVFLLRTKAAYLEVVLPEGSELWSALVNDKPIKPQSVGGRLVVSLPPTQAASLCALKITYQTPVARVGLTGTIDLPAPTLALRADETGEPIEVPLADLEWNLRLPSGYRVVRSMGTATTPIEPPEPAAVNVLKGIAGLAYFSPIMLAPAGRALPAKSYRELAVPKSAAPAIQAQLAVPEQYADQQLAAGEKLEKSAAPPAADSFADESKSAVLKDGEATTRARDRAGRRLPLSGAPARPGEPPKEAAKPGAEMPIKETRPSGEVPKGPEAKPETPTIGGLGMPGMTAAPPSGKPLKKPPTKPRLEGLSSLKIQLVSPSGAGQSVVFQSLGVEPRISVVVADRTRFSTLGWAAALAVLIAGIAITGRSAWAKTKWILAVMAVGTILAVIPRLEPLALPANMAVYAAAALVPYYLLVGLGRIFVAAARRLPRWLRQWKWKKKPAAPATTAAMLLVACLAASALGQTPEPPPEPVKVPDDAVIVPYDPEAKTGILAMEKMLVPYAKYVELWNLAYPDKRLDVKAPPAPFALAGAAYTTTLHGEDYLLVEGRLEIDVLADDFVTVPLGLSGGVLARAELDGKPARLTLAAPADGPPGPQAAPPPQPSSTPAPQVAGPPSPNPRPVVLLYVSGKGRHEVQVTIRMKLDRRGGWRVVDGALPAAPASAFDITVPEAATEVRVMHVADRRSYETTRPGQRIETALGQGGAIGIEWRPKVAEAQVDRALTSRASAVLDVQEDGLRGFWQLHLEFRRSQRDAFRLFVPREFLVEKVEGNNVRGWEVRAEEQRQVVDVSLLKTARDAEQIVLRLWRAGQVGAGSLAEFDVPVVAVADAAMNQGQVTIRRSPLLDVRTVSRSGVTQAELAGIPPSAAVDQSPLGLRPHEAYQFVATPFALRLSAVPVAGSATAEVQTLLKISEFDRTVESRVVLTVRDRPIHRVEVLLPEGFTPDADGVAAPGEYQWVLSQVGKRPMLTVYLAAGRLGELPVVVRGKLPREDKPGRIPLPRIEVRGVERQEGDIAVQADPAYDVTPGELVHCEMALQEPLRRWLKPKQLEEAQTWSIHYRRPDYAGVLTLQVRSPVVSATTITNVRVTERAIEETLLVLLTIQNAGLREVSFVLPAWMKDSRIHVPMLRQKTVEPAGPEAGAPVRVRLEFQDERSGDLRVLVENDRLLTSDTYTVPIPVLKTPATRLQRFVALESAGRDEVVVKAARGVERLSLDQKESEVLKQNLGRITQAYLVRDESPELQIATQRRAVHEFTGAWIRLGETVLVVDAHGAYRGQQVYQVDNTTEQFLEIELPEGAQLWTAHVAGEPVKPSKVPGATGDRRVRIPLIKTAAGDRDYPVVLKYGGKLPSPGVFGQTAFPLLRTVNIKVDQSNVVLHLPETHHWFDFGGTLGPPVDQRIFEAERLAYQRKQQERLLETARSGDDFAKVRALSNLKALAAGADSAGLSRDIQAEIARQQQAPDASGLEDNRRRLNAAYEQQEPTRSKNVVQDLGRNWDAPLGGESKPGAAQAGQFNAQWLTTSQLERPASAPAAPQPDTGAKGWRGFKAKGEATAEGDKFRGPGVGQAQAPGGEPRRPDAPAARRSGLPAGTEQREVLDRYQKRLEQQSAANAPAALDARMQQRLAEQGGGYGYGAAPGAMPPALQPPATQPPAAPAPATAAVAPPVQVPATGLASIDVALPVRGREFYFTTPGGQIEINARAVSERFVSNGLRVALVALGLLVVLVIARAARRGAFAWVTGRKASITILLLGLGMVLVGFVVPGVFALGLVLFLGGLAARLRRAPAAAG
ncbi:MAG: hypothetical protein NUV77_02555 [Thermoguttaceae bacterium]|nr:hypothetical protein [Thermoguttaceae bacterium]